MQKHVHQILQVCVLYVSKTRNMCRLPSFVCACEGPTAQHVKMTWLKYFGGKMMPFAFQISRKFRKRCTRIMMMIRLLYLIKCCSFNSKGGHTQCVRTYVWLVPSDGAHAFWHQPLTPRVAQSHYLKKTCFVHNAIT
jgi:hypothetical protein